MAVFNFPDSPNVNDVYTDNGISWKWTGTVWKKLTQLGSKGDKGCLLYTSPSPRDGLLSRMPSSA